MTVSILKLGNAIEIERTNIDTLRTRFNERIDHVIGVLDAQHSQAAALVQSIAALRETIKNMKHATDEELDSQHEALRVIVEGGE